MDLICLGLNHESAPVAVRERLAISEVDLGRSCAAIVTLDSVHEAVVLSTCNRIEVYALADSGRGDDLQKHLEGIYDLRGAGDLPFYKHRGDASARHLFRVASGLDSMVLGETEILGQVKKAYAAALDSGQTGKALNKLFQQAFNIAKHVRTNSSITRGAISVGAAAVDLAEKIFGDLAKCTVMVIGAGEMGEAVAKTLSGRGVSGLIVSNRSYEKAAEIAAQMNGKAMRLDEGVSKLASADIVISSTGAPHCVLRKEDVKSALKKRRGKPLFLIDIAVPRDIEETAATLSDVYLYDIDALQVIAAEGRKRRQQQIAHCEELIGRQMRKIGFSIPRESDRELGAGDDTEPLPTP